MQESEEADPVIDGDDDDLRVLFHEVGAVVLRVGCSAYLKSATINPHDDWLLLCRGFVSLPDVQVQAILVHSILDSRVAWRLNWGLTIVIGLINVVARSHVHRCLPAQVTDRLLTDKRNALIGNNVLRLLADEGAVDTLDGQRLVVVAVRNLLVGILCLGFCRSRVVHFVTA